MSETRPDRIQLIVTADGSPARKELAETQQAVQKLRTEQEKLREQQRAMNSEREAARKSGNLEEVKRLNTELATVRKSYGEVTQAIATNTARQSELRKEIGITALTLSELRKKAQELKTALATSVEGGDTYKQLESELVQVEARITAVGSATARQLRVWEEYRQTLSLTQMTVQELALEQKRLQAIIEDPTTSTEQYAETARQLGVVKDRTEQLTNANRIAATAWEEQRKGIALVDMTVEQLGLEQKRLQAILANPQTSAEDYARTAKELDVVKDRTEQLTNANRIAAEAWELNRKGVALMDMEVHQLALEQQRLQAILANPKTNAGEYAQAARELDLVKDRTEQLTNANRIAAEVWEKERQSIAFVDLTMEQLEKEMTRLKAAQSKLNPNAQATEFNALGKSIQQTEDRIKTLSNNLNPMQRLWRNVKQEMSGVVGVATSLFAGGVLINQISSWVTGAAKLSDSLANVKKATGLTKSEVQALNKELGTIDTRTATESLREIAVGLGQAGEAASKANVEAIDRIVVALGDEFGDNATGIANTLSVLRNNLNDIKSGNYAEDVTHIGNALNELGANGLATAPVVSDIANRVAGVARTFNISSGAILGTAATFQELGISTERGSTAYIKLLQKMASEPAKFGAVVKAAGMDVNQFASDINNNMQGAFITLAQAAQKAGTDNEAFAGILKELDVDGAGVSELLAKIGTNYGLLQEKTSLATKALSENTSIFQEFADKNSTLGAELDKLSKDVNRAFASRTMQEWFASVITGARDAVKWLTQNRDAIVFWAKVIGNATVAWATYRVTTAAVTSASNAWLRVQATINAATVLFSRRAREAAAAQAAQAAATRAAAVATEAGAAATGTATTAQTALNTAMKLNPIGLIISGITTLIALFVSFGDEVSDAADEQMRLNENLQKFKDLNAGKTDIDKQVRAIDTLNRRQLEALQEQVKSEIQAEEDRVVRFEGQYKRATEVAQKLAKLRAAGDNDGAQVFAMQNAGVLDALAQRLGDAQELVDKAGNRRKASELELTAFLRREEVTRLKNIQTEVALELAGNQERPTSPGAAMSAKVDKETKKVGESMEKLRADLKELRRDMLIDAMSADDAELAQVDVKYQKIRTEILANEQHTADDLAALDEAWGQARANTIEAQGQKRIDAAKKIAEQAAEARRLAEDKLYEQTQTPQDQEIIKTLQDFDAEAQYFEAGSAQMLALEELYQGRLAAIRKKYRDAEAEARAKELSDKVRNFQDNAQAIGGVVSGLQSILAASAAANGKSNAEQTEFQRMLALTQIGISSAVAVAQAIEGGSTLPFPANIAAIATGVGAVLAGIGSAMSILNSTPPTPAPPGSGASPSLNVVPLGKEGGMGQGDTFKTAKAGVLEGPSHNDGGLGVYNERTGKRVAEFEGGEAYMVLSKAFTDLNRDQLGALLAASRTGSRIQISSSTRPLPRPSALRVEQAMQPSYAAGGMVHTRGTALVNMAAPGGRGRQVHGTALVNGRDPGPSDTPPWAAAMLEKMGEMVEAQKEYPTNVQATVRLGPSKDREEARYEATKKRNTFMRA